jgi:hypothetical protein
MNDATNTNYQRQSKAGTQNPFYGHHHSDSSKQKISDAQKQRYQQYKKAIDNIPHVTMDELLGNPKMQEYINYLVKTKIDEMVLRKQQSKVSIPNIEAW